MTKENIGSYEAKTKLPELLRRVQAGEAFTITRRGKPIADLLPSQAGTRQKTAAAIDNISAMSKRTVSERRLKEYRDKGRK